jgi:hypothetical protein
MVNCKMKADLEARDRKKVNIGNWNIQFQGKFDQRNAKHTSSLMEEYDEGNGIALKTYYFIDSPLF